MPRRLPASVLEAKGAFTKDPQRKRIDPVSSGELGEAPSYFSDEQRTIWNELKETLPPGLAKSADRMMAEISVRLMHKFRTSGLTASELSQLINALGRLGLSPADRTKCSIAPEPKSRESEFNEFAQ